MKLDTLIQGRPGTLEVDGPKFRYRREDGQVVEGAFTRQPLEAGSFSILINGNSYRVYPGAPGERVVNGRPLAIEVSDPRAFLVRRGAAATQGRLEIAAQMPGKVVQLLVSAGDPVEAGQGLLVVEAMKMQNEMKSPKTGRVVEVRTKPGAPVAAGEVLMVVE